MNISVTEEEATASETNVCSCCGFAPPKIWRRSVHSSQVRVMIEAYKRFKLSEFSLPRLLEDIARQSPDMTGPKAFGLIEELPSRRADGGPAGAWRVTPEGLQFILGEVLIPKYVFIQQRNILRFEGPNISVHNAIKNKFDYQEIWA